MLRLAEHLGKSYQEIARLPAWEITLWQAKSMIDGPLGALGENCRHNYAPSEAIAYRREQTEAEQQAQFALAMAAFNRVAEENG